MRCASKKITAFRGDFKMEAVETYPDGSTLGM
jgi:hypothetical protein